ncbi:aspartate/glutamate racemase family protein [Falsirhodobacter sp. alg1]|uniref:aspartate/glutamate racemase family protein n=1 Tax=Falsirhodobacter sp. alg1 TaxID=1472418 RepID=UPI000AB407D9|nr:amino acid racemase [Falsirhodobacter sp. alg1]
MQRIGILGGMGPEATILVMQKLLASVAAKDDGDHIPLLVDQNTQIPSRIAHLLEGSNVNPGPVIGDMARRLVAGGAVALAIPCNTAHHYANYIKDSVSVPLLDMIELAAAHAATLAGPEGVVGILGSPVLRKVGLFEPALARHGLTAIYAEDEEATLTAIRQLKSKGPQPEARHLLNEASKALLARGAVVQLIACTEFSLIPDAVSPDATAFDTLDRLVLAIVEQATSDECPRA